MIQIEQKAFDIFLKKVKQGDFKGQRLGQAFYNHFNLEKLVDQTALNNIYEKDGNHAIACICSFVDFV